MVKNNSYKTLEVSGKFNIYGSVHSAVQSASLSFHKGNNQGDHHSLQDKNTPGEKYFSGK